MLQQVARKAVALHCSPRINALGNRVDWGSVAPGLEVEVDPADWMDRSFYLGTCDPWLLHVLGRVIRPADTALDVGAHKGYVALQHSRTLHHCCLPRTRLCCVCPVGMGDVGTTWFLQRARVMWPR